MSRNEISVPRELLRNFIEYSRSTCETDHWEKDKFALCAFLAQRCTCPSGDGSLRWPCPVHQAEATAAASFSDGIEAAAKLIERRMNEYVNEHGSYDHDTGYTEFPGNGEETVEEWLNLAEGIRAIKPDAKEPVCPPEPVAWSLRKDFLVELDGRLTPEQKASGRWTPLYIHPPTKVSGVFPARKKHFETREIGRQPYQNGSVDGWNACLDEFKRLNPGITEAAPLRKS